MRLYLCVTRSSLAELDKKIRDHQQTIQRLREAKGDKLKAFGREMPQVIDEIQRARHMFRKRPLGPIGQSVICILRTYLHM